VRGAGARRQREKGRMLRGRREEEGQEVGSNLYGGGGREYERWR